MKLFFTFGTALLLTLTSSAQMDSHGGKFAAKVSTELTVTGLGGASKTLSPDAFKALPHTTVKVHNAHSDRDESYSGVPLKVVLSMVVPSSAGSPTVSPNMQVIVAGATDDFHVVLTMCDANPDCRSGQALVADSEDGKPLGAEGAFKLILTEDKKPARWARNLQSLTVRSVPPQ